MSSSSHTEHEPGSTTIGVLLLAFIGLGSVLRLYHFWVPDLWLDEYMTHWIAGGGTWNEVVQRAGVNHSQSPFYYLIVKSVIAWLGPNAVALRLPSVLFGIALVALAYPLGLTFFRRRHAALLTVAVFAVNSKLIWYSQEARPYSLALLFAVMSFLSYFVLLGDHRWFWRIVYVLSTTGAYYAHALFGFIVVIQLLHLFWMNGWGMLRDKTWLYTILGIGILCLPTLPRMSALYENRRTLDWISMIQRPTPIDLLEQFVQPRSFTVTVLAVLAVGLAPSGQGVRVESSRRRLLFLWLLLPVTVFGLIPYIFGISLLWDRYILYALPAALLLLAWVMSLGSTTRWRQWTPLAVYLAFVLGVILLPFFQRHGVFADRSPQGWDRAAAILNNFASSEDLILYRTGFIEANQLPFPKEDALMEAYIRSPLTANLPADHPYTLVGLPYQIDAGTRPYIASLIERAAQHRRIWLMGVGDAMFLELGKELALIGFHQVDSGKLGNLPRYGMVKIVLFERT